MAGSRPIPGWAIAPFGRIGQALGWRWVFFFTFPIPYHPWLARALPLLLAAWIAWLALGEGPVNWTAPLWVALILAIPLSVPFLQWILFAFRIHAIQALMLPAALLLLGVAAVRGDVPSWAIAVPILFFALFPIFSAIAHARIRTWQANNRRIDEAPAREGPLPPILVRGRHRSGMAGELTDKLGLPSVFYEDDAGTKEVLRVADPDLIAWLAEIQNMRLELFHMPNSHGRDSRLVHLKGEPAENPCILQAVPASHLPEDPLTAPDLAAPPSAFLKGQPQGVHAAPPGGERLTYWYHRPEPLSWLPAFYFLIRLRLGSNAGFVPEIGFAHDAPRQLGKQSHATDAFAALANALRQDGPPPPPFADPEALRTRVQTLVNRRLGPELSALDRLIASPATWMDRKLDTLPRLPSLYAGRAEELVHAFRTARDAKHEAATILLAKLIAALPDDAFLRVGAPLLEVLNSKRLAGRVKLETAPGEPPAYEGMSLLLHAPLLYERLGELGEPARKVVEGLLKLLPHIEALQRAKAKLDGTGNDPES